MESDATDGYLVTNNDDILQIILQPDLKTLRVKTMDKTVSPVAVQQFTYTTSFTVTALAARAQDDLFVAGTARNGDLVIEHWLIDTQTGAVLTGWSSPGPGAIGQPSPPPAPTSTIVGGTYVPVAQRTGEPSVERVELLRVAHPSVRTNAMAADPEGRFLLFVTEDSSLYSLDLTDPDALPVLLHDATSLWTLPAVTSMKRFDVTGVGRVWSLGPAVFLIDPADGAEKFVIAYLYDADNDGVFDQHVVHDYNVLANSGLWDSVVTDFRTVFP